MNNLIEHVLNEDYVSAQNVFESRLSDILEQKLYEKKRMIQAEAFGGLTQAQIQARKELGWKKAADVLGDPRDRKYSIKKPKVKVKVKKKIKEDIDRAEVEKEKETLRKKGLPTFAQPETPKKEKAPKTIFDKDKKKKKKEPKVQAPVSDTKKTTSIGGRLKGFTKDYGQFMGKLGSSLVSQLGE